MKRFLLMFLLATKLFSQEIPLEVREEITVWVNSSYASNVFGEEVAKAIYKEEIESYEWLTIYALDSNILEQVKSEFPPKKFGYKLLKLLYEAQIKQENM